MKTARRKRTEREALSYLQENARSLTAERRRSARARIKKAAQPNVEVRRIVKQLLKDQVGSLGFLQEVDLSDVQALKVKLIRRDGVIFNPHTQLVADLEREVASGRMSSHDFKEKASFIMSLNSAVSDNYRRREEHYLRTGECEVD